MCGRIAIHTPLARLARIFGAQLGAEIDPGCQPRWNVGPTSMLLGMTLSDDEPGKTDLLPIAQRSPAKKVVRRVPASSAITPPSTGNSWFSRGSLHRL